MTETAHPPIEGAITGPSDADLRDGFASFIEAAQRLEQSYAELKLRAEAIDVQLAEANARLESTLAEREAVFAALPVGVIAMNDDGEIRVCNPAAEQILESGREAGVDVRCLVDGEHVVGELSVRASRVDLPDGGDLLVVEDRSRVVSLEREVDRLDRLAGLSELALGVAHEIKNPLNGVLGFASLLDRHEDPDQIRRCAGKISAGVRQVDEIVKSMLAFARPRDAQIVPRPIAEILESAATEACLPMARIAMSGDLDVAADAPTLVRAIANLMRNSLEAGANGVTARARRTPQAVEIDVQDDGPGIDAEIGSRCFEPFVSSKERGHGLGLALVARVLSFVGGSIELVNPGEPGACFRIRVPHATQEGSA